VLYSSRKNSKKLIKRAVQTGSLFLCYTSPMRLICVPLICLLLLPTCTRRGVNQNLTSVNDTENAESAAIIDPLRIRAEEIAASLNDSLLAAQLLVCGTDGRGSLQPHMIDLFGECPAGGVMLFKYNLDTDKDAVRSLVNETVSLIRSKADIPPFVAVDHEGGSVNRFSRGTASLPAASSYWELYQKEGKEAALEKIRADSLRAGREINELGINLNFAPVAEYLNDDNRVFLENRSYGTDPVFTAEASTAFMYAMQEAGVLCVIKHFPGSAGTDPHYSASSLNLDKSALDKLVYPFADLISRGARAVMAAHTLVPAIDSKIASLSAAVMQNWLRVELGFNGIIISDDFSMAAARNTADKTSPEEAAILSIAAGADMVLVWPSDIKRTHSAFIAAIEDGRLSRERTREAASRIIYEKLKMELIIE